jgi:YhcH/YjgK/YiaL family protein
MGYAPVDSLTPTGPYDPQKDAVMLQGQGDFFTASAGMFVVFFPEDAHMPSVAVNDQPSPIRKVVLKVRLVS